MSSKALSRKTHGLSNEKWLVIVMIFNLILSITKYFLCFYENFYHNLKFKNDYYTKIYFTHFFIPIIFGFSYSLILLFLLVLDDTISTSSGYMKCTICNTILTITMTILMINPIIFECHSKMDENIFKSQKVSLYLHYASIPFVLCSCAYVSFIIWRMSKVKPDYDGDEPYLVIYGGSETKKLLDDSE